MWVRLIRTLGDRTLYVVIGFLCFDAYGMLMYVCVPDVAHCFLVLSPIRGGYVDFAPPPLQADLYSAWGGARGRITLHSIAHMPNKVSHNIYLM